MEWAPDWAARHRTARQLAAHAAVSPQLPRTLSCTSPAAQSRQLLLVAGLLAQTLTQVLRVQPAVQLKERAPGQSRTLPLTSSPVLRACQMTSVRSVRATSWYRSQVGV